MNRPVIIGAGVAGLSAANYLCDSNIYPIVVEADVIGKDKVCGEFISPPAEAILNNWGIDTHKITSATFYSGKQEIDFKLRSYGSSLSRSELELKLLERAINKGTTIISNTTVTNLEPAANSQDFFVLQLSNANTIIAPYIIIAAGRFYSSLEKNGQGAHTQHRGAEIMNTMLEDKYVGIKAHFKIANPGNNLNFFTGFNSYCGLTINGVDRANLCCLTKVEEYNAYDCADTFMQSFISKHAELNRLIGDGHKLHDSWLTCKIKSFGYKKTPDWPNAYFIGDSAATIAPASGNGLGVAITSALMACKYAIANNHKNYKKDWYVRYGYKFAMAKLLHHALLNPVMHKIGYNIGGKFPSLATEIFEIMR